MLKKSDNILICWQRNFSERVLRVLGGLLWEFQGRNLLTASKKAKIRQQSILKPSAKIQKVEM
jgi:hypothetical protein